MQPQRETLLRLAETGDRQALLDRLDPIVRRIHSYGGGCSVEDNLLTEALDLAKANLMTDAAVRLRRRADPKFDSVEECQAAYDAAMREQRTCI